MLASARPKTRVYIAARSAASNRFRPYLRWRYVIELIEAVGMGRYIDEILQPGEKVLYSTNAHWIFYWPAIVAWIVVAALLIVGTAVPPLVPLSWAAAAVIAVAAVYFTIRGWFHRLTTETDVTDRRVVH